MTNSDDAHRWTVLLVAGASGIGKSTLARALAQRYGVPVTSGDDIVTAVLAMTDPSNQPVLHR